MTLRYMWVLLAGNFPAFVPRVCYDFSVAHEKSVPLLDESRSLRVPLDNLEPGSERPMPPSRQRIGSRVVVIDPDEISPAGVVVIDLD